MLKDTDYPLSGEYRSKSGREPLEFYLNCLLESNNLDLLLGYFSSSAINVLSLGFAMFLANGGKVRLVINHFLSKNDKAAILKGLDSSDGDYLYSFKDIELIRSHLNSYGEHFFNCLSWLIANDRICIVSVRPIDNDGMAHFKSGVFSDGENQVSFSASCNFTYRGLISNLEKVSIKRSWVSEIERIAIHEEQKYFEEIFSGSSGFVEYVPSEDIIEVVRKEFGNKDLEELLVQEKDLLSKKKQLQSSYKLKMAIQKAEEEIVSFRKRPRFPFPNGPRDYQREAYHNWVANGMQGILAMATGTGKTITALNCILNEVQKSEDKVYHAFILAPTITLVEQWAEEAKSFNFQDIITVSSRSKWESRLATTLSTSKRIPTSFIVIGTYASFIRERFHKYIKKLPDDTIFIADEAHNVGAKSVIERLKAITIKKRIGLSATPKRIYDPEGSKEMEYFFGDEEPYTYSYSMEKAITNGILCQYDYHPHLVQLTNYELEEYAEITKKLARLFGSNGEGFENHEIAERLLLKRKRIIHKAENKLPKVLEILQRRYEAEGNLKYTFVYVPEGFVNAIEDNDDVVESNEENLRIIKQYTRAIGNIDHNILVNQFVSGMPDREDVLDQFKQGRIQVIASMKCLDEGVDIPRAEHAIFCSSTGNPRQFIQRRGRILRRHPDKHKATIHDLVVIPDLSMSSKGSETYNLERNLVKKEIERVMYFASLSQNPNETEYLFEEVCNHFDLNIYTIYNELKTA